ncbi:Hypothetical protein UVM_LOCUS277 [uncultured virus]|nr:Hypothetical protein UVM_LOCUS277 [uncultured virus]
MNETGSPPRRATLSKEEPIGNAAELCLRTVLSWCVDRSDCDLLTTCACVNGSLRAFLLSEHVGLALLRAHYPDSAQAFRRWHLCTGGAHWWHACQALARHARKKNAADAAARTASVARLAVAHLLRAVSLGPNNSQPSISQHTHLLYALEASLMDEEPHLFEMLMACHALRVSDRRQRLFLCAIQDPSGSRMRRLLSAVPDRLLPCGSEGQTFVFELVEGCIYSDNQPACEAVLARVGPPERCLRPEALQIACASASLAVVRWILQMNVLDPSEPGNAPLQAATAAARPDVVRLLLMDRRVRDALRLDDVDSWLERLHACRPALPWASETTAVLTAHRRLLLSPLSTLSTYPSWDLRWFKRAWDA